MIPIDPVATRIGEALTARELGWAIAGGWAIDMFLGRVARWHADVDVAVRRDEHQARDSPATFKRYPAATLRESARDST